MPLAIKIPDSDHVNILASTRSTTTTTEEVRQNKNIFNNKENFTDETDEADNAEPLLGEEGRPALRLKLEGNEGM